MCTFSVVHTHLTHKLLFSMAVFMVFLRIAQGTEQDAWNDALPLSILHTEGLFNNHYILSLEQHLKPFLSYHLIIAVCFTDGICKSPQHIFTMKWEIMRILLVVFFSATSWTKTTLRSFLSSGWYQLGWQSKTIKIRNNYKSLRETWNVHVLWKKDKAHFPDHWNKWAYSI